ncbi:hypothetical protein RYX36_032804 [Vicia faba]
MIFEKYLQVSHSSSLKRFWDLCDNSKTFWNASDSSDLSGAANNGARRITSSSISPGSLSEFQSDSSSDLHVELSLAHADSQKEDDFNPYFNSFSNVLLSNNLILNIFVPQNDSVNSSFQFDCLTMPYDSIELGKLQKELNGQEPWLWNSTLENGLQSQMGSFGEEGEGESEQTKVFQAIFKKIHENNWLSEDTLQ